MVCLILSNSAVLACGLPSFILDGSNCAGQTRVTTLTGLVLTRRARLTLSIVVYESRKAASATWDAHAVT